MYAKVFSQIYDGTLCTKGPWQALVTFQQMLVLADLDGNVDMTPAAISRRTTIPLDIIETGIAELALPDPESRTPTAEGRRILPLSADRSWGWKIVNYSHYRELKREEDRREYHRQYWHKRKAANSTDSTATQHAQQNQPKQKQKQKQKHEYIEPTVLVDSATPRPRIAACPTEKILESFHEHLPMLPQVVVVSPARKAALSGRWREVVTTDKMDEVAGLEWFAWYWQHVSKSKFLTGKTSNHGGRVWKADFDWLLKPANFAKTVEGNYHKDQV
jgi:hypothetical protein